MRRHCRKAVSVYQGGRSIWIRKKERNRQISGKGGTTEKVKAQKKQEKTETETKAGTAIKL